MSKQNSNSNGGGGGGLEWVVKVEDSRSEIRVLSIADTSTNIGTEKMRKIKDGVHKMTEMVHGFLEKAWKIARNEPIKVIHCIKVSLALTFVSLFYYMRPLYNGFGGNAMWAVMTVVVVYEYTVGSTLYKCINRVIGTTLAGCLGIGVHWVASRSGEELEPVILQFAVFLLAAAATFSRFIPVIKARFDYGAMIFILTFSLVSVSGYRIDKLVDLARQRLTTIVIGTTICVITTMLFCPVWAGQELHTIVTNNIQKLADSLDECVADFLKNEDDNSIKERIQGYKCVLNSKASEEAMANFARWEPAHGNFNFRHPWKQYLKLGASLRNCACYIDTLNGSISSKAKAPQYLKKHFSSTLQNLGTNTSNVLKEMSIIMKTMTKSSNINLLLEEMNISVIELQNAFKSIPNYNSNSSPTFEPSQPPDNNNNNATTTNETEIRLLQHVVVAVVPLMEIAPLIQAVSLLTEIAGRVKAINDAVNELANEAEFKSGNSKTTTIKINKINSTKSSEDDNNNNNNNNNIQDNNETIITLQRL